jgi:hypothetical protein
MSAGDVDALRSRHFEVMMDANARYPQVNSAISLALFANYMKAPLRLDKLLPSSTPEETAALAEKMNRIHEAYGIPVATVGYVTKRHVRYIPLSALKDLANGFSRLAIRNVVRMIGALRPDDREAALVVEMSKVPLYKQIGPMSDFVEKFFSAPHYAKDAEKMRRLGTKLEELLASDELTALSVNFKSSIRYGYAKERGENVNPPPVLLDRKSFCAEIQRLLATRLAGEFPPTLIAELVFLIEN